MTMRDPVRRTRWMVHTLLLACVGIFSSTVPSSTPWTADEAALVLSGADAAQALPAPSWTFVVEAPGGASSNPARRTVADRAPAPHARQPTALGPSGPEAAARARSDFLLGLPAAPANAPPVG